MEICSFVCVVCEATKVSVDDWWFCLCAVSLAVVRCFAALMLMVDTHS